MMDVQTLFKNSSFRKKTFLVMGRSNGLKLNKLFNTYMSALILLNVFAVILQTVPAYDKQYHNWFILFETFSVIIFSIEYAFRFWSSREDTRYGPGIKGRLKFFFSPMSIIDILAILPGILLHIIPLDLRVLRAIRLFRIVRLIRLARYSYAIKKLVDVVKLKGPELTVAMSFAGILLLVSSTVMYYVEHDAQPDKFSSIPATMWWAMATLTTVGYGDIYPITTLGKFLGSVISFLGLGLFALPAGIIASGFGSVMDSEFQHDGPCPLCGHDKSEDSPHEEHDLEAA